MTELASLLFTAFTLGLLGSGHCLGMCGGIAAAVSNQNTGKNYSVYFSLGRIFSYALIGLLLGSVAQVMASNMAPFMLVLRSLTGLLLIAMGLYMGNWWLGLLKLEKIGAKLWQRVQPLTQKLLPINSAGNAIRLGLLWGLLPCGLIYSTLTWAASSGNGISAALIMLFFGLGTMPAMLSVSWLGQRLRNFVSAKTTRQTAALLLIVFGLWTLYSPLKHATMASGMHAKHQQNQQHSHH